MARFQDPDFSERRKNAVSSRQALLDKFKQRPADDDPDVAAKREERRQIAEAREARETAKREERERVEAERTAREAEERARVEAEERVRREAEELARKEAEELARKEASERSRREREEKALWEAAYAAAEIRKKKKKKR